MPNHRLEALKAYLKSQGWKWEPGKTVPYGEQIVIRRNTDRATATYYPKRQIIVLGGAESPLKTALAAWLAQPEAPPTSKGPTDSAPAGLEEEPDRPYDSVPHIGMDESGKGDLFGPLALAAVFVTPQDARRLREIGVQDSKKISAAGIRGIAGKIRDILPDRQYRVRALMPEEYNRLYAETGNLNHLLAGTYAALLLDWERVEDAELLLCDQFARRAELLEEAFQARGLPAPRQQTGAESASTAVAAASILANAAFTEAMEQLGREAGLERPLPKGASDRETLNTAASAILERDGRAGLARYAKLHFKPVQEWMNSLW